MLGNQQMWSANNGESSERINISYSEHLCMALKKTAIPIVEDYISKGEIHSVQQLLNDSFRKAIDEILSRVVEKSIYRKNWNSTDETTITRNYELRFLVQVSDPVLTGVEIRGKDDTDIKIHLYDQVTGNPVVSGPESKAKVEILFLDAGVDNFNNSIITADNKPQFRKRISVKLEKGVCTLPKNLKIGHGSRWMKSCKCRLGARVVNFFVGSRIKEASTDSFTVLDRRSKLKEKHDQPSLFDDVWRLKNIGKHGARCNRLRMKNVSTIQEFLFLHSVDPQRLQEIFGASPDWIWKSTVNHADQCDTDDKKIYYLQYSSSSSSECTNGVVFDVVGKLKGILRSNSYFPIESVAEAEKDDARKLLAYAFENQKEAPASRNKKKASAFENWNDIASFDDVASFLCEFPSSNDSNSSRYFGPSSSRNVYPSFGTIGEDQGLSMSDVSELMETETVLSLFNENELSLSNDNNVTNATGMAFINDEASVLRESLSISIDDNPTNSTGLEGHFGHHTGNVDNSNQQPSEFANSFFVSNDNNATNATGLDFDNDEAFVLRELLSMNATNSIGLDGYYGHHNGNAEYFNQQPSEFADSVPNSPMWNF